MQHFFAAKKPSFHLFVTPIGVVSLSFCPYQTNIIELMNFIDSYGTKSNYCSLHL